jgi:predicted anti-sigma-YlaC factor YlaD
MDCERWRESLSALADGEDPGVDVRLVDAHLARCAGCRQFKADLEALSPAGGGGAGEHLCAVGEQHDLSRSVVARVAAEDRASHPLWLRLSLLLTAVGIIAVGAPKLLWADSHMTDHAARHLGAFTVAYGVGLLVLVVRPARARAFLPVAAVVAGGLLITATVDVVRGGTPILGELKHVLEFASVGMVWLLAPRSPRRPEGDAFDADAHRRAFRIVDGNRRAG